MRTFVCNRKSPDWQIGQHFIAEDDLSAFLPARLERKGKNSYTIVRDGKIERPFTQIADYVVEITR